MLEVELSPINLADVGKKCGGVPTIFLDEAREVSKQLFLVEVLQTVNVDHEADATMGV